MDFFPAHVLFGWLGEKRTYMKYHAAVHPEPVEGQAK
jgi:hypothetical protein